MANNEILEKHCELCGILTPVNNLNEKGLCKICSEVSNIVDDDIIPDDEDYDEEIEPPYLDYPDYYGDEDD